MNHRYCKECKDHLSGADIIENIFGICNTCRDRLTDQDIFDSALERKEYTLTGEVRHDLQQEAREDLMAQRRREGF